MYDENIIVKKTIEKEIIDKFPLEAIVGSFIDKPQQKASLKIAIRDILDKNLNLTPVTQRYFKDLFLVLEMDYSQDQNYKNTNYDQNKEINNNYSMNIKYILFL